MADNTSRYEGAARATTAMPVVEGALAFIVISFVATVWESISPERQTFAFEVVFGSGAHFIFSFLIVTPAFVLSSRMKSGVAGAFTLAMLSYVFWSLILQHRGLANMLLPERWRIPIPFANEINDAMESVLGPQITFFFGPLIFSYVVLTIALAVVWLSSTAFGGARKTGRAR